jgi:MraZ protein
MVFRGGPVLTLDGKGRITVPSRWRDVLMATVNGQMVVAKHPHGCLSLFPMNVWEQFETNVLALTAEEEAWRRFYMGSATEVEIDGGARVLIPPELREWAGLEKEVKFMGVGPHFELWDLGRHRDDEAQARARGRPASLLGVVLR